MWTVEYSKRFLKELAAMPEKVRHRAEEIAFTQLRRSSPFSLGYIEQMKGYPDKFKIRIGSYRMGLTIKKSENRIICQRIVHRKDIYRVFP